MELLAAHHAVVKGKIVLGEGQSFAFHGAGDHHRRRALMGAGGFECRDYLNDVVPVDLGNAPSEGSPFGGQRSSRCAVGPMA
jgi:hypothetical protein